MFERCNFACLELSGFMPLPCKLIENRFCLSTKTSIFGLDEEVFNDLTEMELREHLNGIALSLEEQKRIKEDVKNLLENEFL